MGCRRIRDELDRRHDIYVNDKRILRLSRALCVKFRRHEATRGGPMEGFWGILKRERYYGFKFTDRTLLMQMITGYINFYNYHRLQRCLSVMTPMEFHQHFALPAQRVTAPHF